MIYFIYIAAIVCIIGIFYFWIDTRRVRRLLTSQTSSDASFQDTAALFGELSILALRGNSNWRLALRRVASILERSVGASAEVQGRSPEDVAYDAIVSISFGLKHNLYHLDELVYEQLLNPYRLVWNLASIPLDLVSVHSNGWYEKARALLNSGGQIIYFQNTEKWVKLIRQKLEGDEFLDSNVIINEDVEGCQVWCVFCDESLLLPEVVIWDPDQNDKMRGFINSGDPIEIDEIEQGYVLNSEVTLKVSNLNSKILRVKLAAAERFYNNFIEERKRQGMFVPSMPRRKSEVSTGDLKRSMALPEDVGKNILDRMIKNDTINALIPDITINGEKTHE